MKNIESLKKEQVEAKQKLVELVEFINSEEFYSLSQFEKDLISYQRTGLELYSSSLTRRLYSKEDHKEVSNLMWLSMLYGISSSSFGFGPSSSADYLKKTLDEKDFEIKEESDEPGCSD